MKGYLAALCLPLLLGAAGAASATTAVINFSDNSKTKDIALVSSNADGKLNQVTRAGINAVQTTGSTDGTAGYLYVSVTKGLFDKSAALWAVVSYFDEGKDTFEVDYNGYDVDASSGDKTGNPTEVANPQVKQKFDTKVWTSQVFKLPNFKLQGGMPGGADLRIDDKGDGPEIIGSIMLTDQDPEKVHFPHVDPAHPITIDGVIDPGEWDGAKTFTLNAAAQDALNGANWDGPQDFSGAYSFKWDEKGLYVLGQVTDATPRLNDAGGSPPNYYSGDGMELYIGLDDSNPNRTSYLPDTDFQVVIAMGDPANGSIAPSWVVYHGTSGLAAEDKGAVPAQNLAIKNTTNPKGYMFELFLPWTLLKADAKVTPGQDIGWNMFGNDGKELPSGQDVAMSPFGRKNMYKDPSGWVAVTLDTAITVTNPPSAGQ